jgi:hypothetical protein
MKTLNVQHATFNVQFRGSHFDVERWTLNMASWEAPGWTERPLVKRRAVGRSRVNVGRLLLWLE